MQSHKRAKRSAICPHADRRPVSPKGAQREVRYPPKQKRQERYLKNRKEDRDLFSSRQETPETVKTVRRAHMGSVSALGLKYPCPDIVSVGSACLSQRV